MTLQNQSLSPGSRAFEAEPTFEDRALEEQALNFNELISKYVYRWPLFLISLLVAVTAAYFYLKSIEPVYEVKARLLIKDENKLPNKEAALKELDLFRSNKVVDNEIEILKSRRLLSQVVNALQLSVAYWLQDDKGKTDLYGRSPVRFSAFSALNFNSLQQNFDILVKSKSRYSLKVKDGPAIEAAFNKPVTNDLGTWQLDATDKTGNFIGQNIQISVFDSNEVTDLYARKLMIQVLNKQASVIELSIQDALPERGKEVLNNLIEYYIFYTRDEKNRVARSTLDFINDRLSSLTGELNQAEMNVEGYRSSQGLTDISSESKLILDKVHKNDNDLNGVNVQLHILAGLERTVNAPKNTGVALATIGISDPTLTELINQLIRLQRQREELLASTPETNPVFDPINRQIRITKAALKENIQGIKSSLLATRKQLQTYNSRFENSIKKLPEQDRLLVNVKRQQSIKENLYVYLLQKREEISFSYASDLTESPTIDPAFTGKPTVPNKYRILLMALLLGLLFPAALIYGNDVLRNRITSRRKIEGVTSVPVLSELLFQEGTGPIVQEKAGTSILGEQLRTLRTNLKFLHGGTHGGRVTLITSSVMKEGKSFITTNLAVLLAASGRKTILLDLDLRKPKIAKTFHLPAQHLGLTDYLQGQAPMEAIIQPCEGYPNLFIISAGPTSAFASELLEQSAMDALISYLRKVYDDIVFDTPPVHLVTDALVLSRFSEVTLYVLRQGVTPASELGFIRELVRQQKLPNLNLIFNGVQVKGKYGYGYNNRLYSDYFAARNSNPNPAGSALGRVFRWFT